jgi:hypothetical protein
MHYLVTRDCEIDGVQYARGDTVIIEHPAHAARLMSDHEGLLMPIPERALDAPPHDRQIKAAKSKR